MITNADIARNIRIILKSKDINECDFMKNCGLNKKYLYDFKRSSPRIDNLLKIAECLDVKVELFFEEEIGDIRAELETPLKVIITDDGESLLCEYNKLNLLGKEEAIKRVAELTQISKYVEEFSNVRASHGISSDIGAYSTQSAPKKIIKD